jgi:cytochrome c oxidase cbb3-type subunit 3
MLILLLLLQADMPGKRIFEGQCALCHGQTAQGGRGPNLAQPRLRRAPDDAAMFRLIQYGIQGTEMDGAWQMTDDEIRQVVAYVRSLGNTPREELPGDATRGKSLYGKNGCASCHVVSGAGTGFGPELTEVGAKRSAANLREHLTDPGKSTPEGFMMVRAVARDGHKFSGARINEDSFTVQIRDASGALHSLRKRDLVEYKKLPGESPMPSFRTLSSAELDDLVAYLASLRGSQ